jgi:chromosome segregation ATPase
MEPGPARFGAEQRPVRAREGGDLDERVRALEEELLLLRRAHEVRGERLVAERAAFGEHMQILNEEVLQLAEELEWRRRTMDEMEKDIAWRTETMERLEVKLNTPLRRALRPVVRRFRTPRD